MRQDTPPEAARRCQFVAAWAIFRPGWDKGGVMRARKKRRLLTRSDFDGLVCAVLLKHLDRVDGIEFLPPETSADELTVDGNDITVNLPYVPGVHLAFGHHADAARPVRHGKHVIELEAPSAARVVYDYFGGAATFPERFDAMMAAVDQAQSGRFSRAELLHPTGWALLNFLVDLRSGLGRSGQFRVSNDQLMRDLVDHCRTQSIDEVLQQFDVKERADLYFDHEEPYKEQLRRRSTRHGNLVVVDLREERIIYVGNRFLIYALYPDCNISIHILWGLKQESTVFAFGKSILNRTSATDIAALASAHGGGGQDSAGRCQVDNDRADELLRSLIGRITAEG